MIDKNYIQFLENKEQWKTLSFKELTDTTNEQLISTQAIIQDVTEPKFIPAIFSYNCSYCGSKNKEEHIHYPFKIPANQKKDTCQYCGHITKLWLNTRAAEYRKIQKLTLTSENTTQTIQAVLYDENCSNNYKPHDKIQIKAQLSMERQNKNTITQLLRIYEIQIINEEHEEHEEQETNTSTRKTQKYKEWVTKIQKRDKVCQCCGGNKHLEAHHMYNYKNHPKLRLDEGNGILLCTFCHNKFHSYYGVNVTPADLVKFLYRFRGR